MNTSHKFLLLISTLSLIGLTGCTAVSTKPIPRQNISAPEQQILPTTNTNVPVEPSNSLPTSTLQKPSPKIETLPPTPNDFSRLHKDCSEDSCPSTMQCMTYLGMAGEQGPRFSTCEIPCVTDAQCPASTHCGVISDGAGRVCS